MKITLKHTFFLLICLLTKELNGQKLSNSLLFSDPVTMSLAINSQYEESMPVLAKDSSKLYFVRTFHPDNAGGEDGDQDIWVSTRIDGQWTTAINVEDLNNEENNGAFGINQNDSIIYLLNAYLKHKRTIEKGVVIASKKNGEWTTKSETLPIPDLEINGDYYGFHVNSEETVLLISNKGQGSLGEEDLYVSLKDSSGNWGSPIHLGPKINSKGYEMSPFLSPDTDTLYFSSNGHGGFGEADIFYSVRMDHTWQNWSEPTNLGPQINSEAFDAYFIRSDNEVYWSSNRNGELSDIFTAKVVGWVWSPLPPRIDTSRIDTVFVQADPGEVVVVKQMLHKNDTIRMEDKGDTLVITVPRDTLFYIQLPKQSPPIASNDSFPPQTTRVDTVYITKTVPGDPPPPIVRVDTVYIDKNDPTDVMPPQVRVDTVFITKNDPPADAAKPSNPPGDLDMELLEAVIYFDLDKYYLTFDSRMILNRVAMVMEKYPDWHVRMEGHCDIRGTDQYNMWLSDKRVLSARKYLVDKGISESRLNLGYYGEKRLAVETPSVNSSEDDHRQNRRVTIQFGTPQDVGLLPSTNPIPDIPKSPIHGYTVGGNKNTASNSSGNTNSSTNVSNNNSSNEVGEGIVYKVQLMSTNKDLDLSHEMFSGLENVGKYKRCAFIEYTAGEFSSIDEARAYRSVASQAGYEGVFVVKFVNGKRVSI